MRKALVQVHLWTGLALGLYVLVSSVTGAVLVYHEALGHAAQASLHRTVAATPPNGRSPLTMDGAAQALARALPDARVLSLAPPQTDAGTFEAGLLADGYRLAFIDPGTAHVTGPVAPGGAVMSWLHEVHANLLGGRNGRLANGIGALVLVLLAGTGLVIWWPRSGQWRRALLLKRRVGWKRFVFDLHHVVGFWMLVPVLVLSITGAFFTWPGQYRAVIGWFSPLRPDPVPTSDASRRADGPASLDEALATARRAAPGLQVVRIGLPGGERQPYTVFMRDPSAPASPRSMSRVFIDRYSGTLLEVRAPGLGGSAGDWVASWIGPLHTGGFGGPLIKAIWAIAGLAPAVLFASGFLMWWHRVVQPRRRTARRRAVSARH